ncbi:MAG: bifunctional shikimate kinase/3-dehydroquinate synthase, partial [Solirubrobacterales bacterium]
AARQVASALGTEAVDTDGLVEHRAGRPIPELFATEGEPRFRELEREVVGEAVARGGVIALGGGAVESREVRDALEGQVVVRCEVSEDVAWERSRGTARPLASDREEFARRFAARAPLYREVSRAALPQGGPLTPELAAPWLELLRERPDLRLLWGFSAGGEYPVLVGEGAGDVLDEVDSSPARARLICIYDSDAVEAGVPLSAGVALKLGTHGGEEAKTFANAERLLSEMARQGVLRDDVAVALGGGVVGDLAGFCAAVYQRGIGVVQVPTTLVAQVDSAYGGKTGVDLPEAKNYVGAYHQPLAVLADPERLRTLPQPELAAGFAEVVKTALIAGGGLWERVRAIESVDAEAMAGCVFDCAETKLAVVADDERDGGRRKVLNLGHTVGHAIETATGYARYRHGEAVALGLLAALRLSGRGDLRDEVAALWELAGLPVRLDSGVDPHGVIEATAMDKKRTSEGLGFVLVRAPGEVVHDRPVNASQLRSAVEELTA